MSLHRRIALLTPLVLAFCADAASAADTPGLGKPVSEADIALAIHDFDRMEQPWRDLFIEAVKEGLLANTGKRDDQGRVIWVRTTEGYPWLH